jgi:hypothetical protein
MENLVLNREGWLKSSTHRQCTNCLQIFEITSKTVTLCKKCNSGRVKTQSAEMKMYRRAKSRAKIKNLEFNIKPNDIEIPLVCPILDIPLIIKTGKSGGNLNSPSLDRINSSLGYTKENIQVISHLANMIKSCADIKTLIKFSKYIINNYDE